MAIFPDLPPLLAAVFALGIVLALVWLAGRLVPRFLRAGSVAPGRVAARGPAGRSARLARVETLALGPRHRLHLIRCDARDVLLLTGGPQDVVVGWLPGEVVRDLARDAAGDAP